MNRNSNAAMAFAIVAMGKERVDKGGNPYVLHLCETVATLQRWAKDGWPFDDEIAQAAILHDTVEDTEATLDDLRDYGFSERVVALVDALTQRPVESKLDYWGRVCAAGDAARAIKAADAESNSRLERLGREASFGEIQRAAAYGRLSRVLRTGADTLLPEVADAFLCAAEAIAAEKDSSS